MHRLIAAMLAAASCASLVQAQTPPPVEAGGTLTLDQALASAGLSAPILEAAQAGIRSADAARTVAGLHPNPEITVEAENVAGSGPYRALDSLEATTAIGLPIELGRKRSARVGVADARFQRARIEAAIAEADLRLSVIDVYAEAAAAERRLEVARDQARIAAEALRGAEVRVEAGRASPIEIQRAGVAKINADSEVQRAERLAEVSRFTLSRLIGQPVTGKLDARWFAGVHPRHGPRSSIESAGTLALAAAQADLAIAEAGVRLAHAQRYPDLTLSGGARRFRESGDTAAVFSLTLPLPVLNSGRAALEQASSKRLGAEARQRAAVIEVEQAIARVQADVANAATSALAASGPALAAAEEAARIARIGYREGKFGQLDLLDAERTLAQTRLEAIDALLSYHVAEARLERLTSRAPGMQGN